MLPCFVAPGNLERIEEDNISLSVQGISCPWIILDLKLDADTKSASVGSALF